MSEVIRRLSGVPAGKYQLVDDRDALLGIDEQPLPVLRHHLDLERLDGGVDPL